MQRLADSLSRLSELKSICTRPNPNYTTHTYIDNRPITDSTISIIMTSSNRSKQVYYTLFTFLHSTFKDIHIVLVDDSDIDPVSTEILSKFPFAIDFVQVNRANKFWMNPCVNYNIAFHYRKGKKIILQNSEVCHVGDVLAYVQTHVQDTTYHVLDVKACAGYASNDFLYEIHNPLTTDIYNAGLFSQWYQHARTGNRQLHFLVAFTESTFATFQGFSFDYAFSADFDDDDLLLLVKSKGIEVLSIPNEETQIGGIHLYHTLAGLAWTNRTSNETLFRKKQEWCAKYPGLYLEVSEGTTVEEHIRRFDALRETHMP
jgi:hypothetical protein